MAVGDPEAAGEEKLDEEALKGMASTTSGRFFRAADREQLGEIYTELDALESHEIETVSHSPRTDVFWVPLAAGLLLNMLFHAVQALRHAAANRRTRQPDANAGEPEEEAVAHA